MASEKAIQEALRVFFTDVVVKDEPTRMRASLDAAAAVDGDAPDFARLDSIQVRLDARYADTEAGTVIRALIKDAKLEIHDLAKRYRPVDGDAGWNAAIEAATKAAIDAALPEGMECSDDWRAGQWHGRYDAATAIRSLKRLK